MTEIVPKTKKIIVTRDFARLCESFLRMDKDCVIIFCRIL